MPQAVAHQPRASAPPVPRKGAANSATLLLRGAALELKSAAEGALPSKFSGTAYSGGYVPDYQVVIDMATTTYKQRMPLLDSHSRWSIVGVIEQASTENHSMQVAGKLFSDMAGSEAERIAQLAQRGVPYEMSVGLFNFTREFVPAGKSVNVNGQTFNGPVNVLRNGQVREVSVVTLGADPDTETQFLSLPPTGEDPMNLEQLQAQVAELTAQAAAHAAALAAATDAGATAERARIQAVYAQAMPGHEKLVQQLAFDGKTTGPEAAVAVLNAERALRTTAASNLALDAPQPIKPAAAPAVQLAAGAAAQEDTSLPLEERCKATWEKDASVRAEFGTLAQFTALRRAEEAGRVRVLRSKAA